MGMPIPSRPAVDWARNAFLVFLAFCLVLFVVSSPVTAEMTGRSKDRLELEQAKRDLREANIEIKRLRERLDAQVEVSTRFISVISSDVKDIKSKFIAVDWLAEWIRSGTRR